MESIVIRLRLLIALPLAVLLGCSSTGSDTTANTQGPSLTQVRAAPGTHLGQRIRWGGRIAAVENRNDATRLQIVEQPLKFDDRPRNDNTSEGRFIASFDGFLDPVIYAAGKEITVTGTVVADEQGKIGEYSYRFPLVAVSEHTLWKAQKTAQTVYYYDPFFSPFYHRRHRRY